MFLYNYRISYHLACLICRRITLAFWRGLNNSDIRQKLLEAWENDLELYIQKGRKPSLEEGDLVYHEAFNNSKYCICPGGPELDRTIALAIHYGCVPGDRQFFFHTFSCLNSAVLYL